MPPPPSIPLPPAVQQHELQYKILRERQLLARLGDGTVSEGRSSAGRGDNNDGASQRSSKRDDYEGGSTRTASSRAGGGARTSSTSRSGVSISSSVALGKLNKLEEMLLEERKARQGAEVMLVSLQKERVAREEAVRQSQATRKQLDELMAALRTVVQHPDEAGNVRKLQQLIDTKRVDSSEQKRRKADDAAADSASGAERFAKNGTSLAPPVDSKYTKKIAHQQQPLPAIDSSSNRSNPQTFLDGLGHYERARERERAKEKAGRR